MSKVHKKTEPATNTLIIVVALALGGFLIQKYFFLVLPTAPEQKSPAAGNKISDIDSDWSKSGKNVLLVLSESCRYSTESTNFYKGLIQQAKDENVKITALLPQSKEEAGKYPNDSVVSGIEIKPSRLDSLNVGGTPAIIVANDKGEISDV
jgi:hypothetical protein